jgi:hypothetical protein
LLIKDFVKIAVEHYCGSLHRGSSYFLAERYLPVPVPAAWSARLGRHEIANLDPEDWTRDLPENLRLISRALELQIENDVLVIELLDGLYAGRLVVAPVSDTAGYMPGGGRNLAGSVRIVTVDGEEEIRFLGLRDR